MHDIMNRSDLIEIYMKGNGDLSGIDSFIHSKNPDIELVFQLLCEDNLKMKEKLTSNVMDDLVNRVIAFFNKKVRTAHDTI